jgi:23S rRNA (uracil1939-C5)-methyltransferase
MLTVGQTLELTIADLAFGGDGVARTEDGEVVFVPFTAAGDRALVEVVQTHARFARGEVKELLAPGPGRTEPVCPHFQTCGGCRYQHLTYETEVATKGTQLRDALHRLGGIADVPELAVQAPSPADYGYRNKLRVEPLPEKHETQKGPVVFYGYCQLDNKTYFELDRCPLAKDGLNELLPKAPRTDWGKRNANRDKPRPMTLRITDAGETHYYFGRAPESIPWLTETLLERPVRVPLGAFWQVNPGAADALVRTVRDWFAESPTHWLVDAYAGVGTFALALGDLAERLVLIESDRNAALAADHNLMQWGLLGKIMPGRTEKMLHGTLVRAPSRGTTLVLDPPRTGCGPTVLKAILRHKPKQVFYVSCNASTLGRDLKALCAKGPYKLTRAGLVDMFPRTAHFESVVQLTLAE